MSTAAAEGPESPTRSRRRGRKATATASSTRCGLDHRLRLSHPYRPRSRRGEPREAWSPACGRRSRGSRRSRGRTAGRARARARRRGRSAGPARVGREQRRQGQRRELRHSCGAMKAPARQATTRRRWREDERGHEPVVDVVVQRLQRDGLPPMRRPVRARAWDGACGARRKSSPGRAGRGDRGGAGGGQVVPAPLQGSTCSKGT